MEEFEGGASLNVKKRRRFDARFDAILNASNDVVLSSLAISLIFSFFGVLLDF